MPIILSQTYEIVTEESAENGDAEERGFDWQDVPHTFRETVELINRGGFFSPSNSHGVPGWLSDDPTPDYQNGVWETTSLHPARDARSQRYWEKACRAAGLVKDWQLWRSLIRDAHYRGLRAEVTYIDGKGERIKGLAINDALRGVGPAGVWFVAVDNFANRIPLSMVCSVKQVIK